MRFANFKIKRCKDCKWYRCISNKFHFCERMPLKAWRNFGYTSTKPLSLICFKKEKVESNGR